MHDAAIVYLYRPDSKWNRQEIVAASMFINKHRIPSLLHNHYYWVELCTAVTVSFKCESSFGCITFPKTKVFGFSGTGRAVVFY